MSSSLNWSPDFSLERKPACCVVGGKEKASLPEVTVCSPEQKGNPFLLFGREICNLVLNCSSWNSYCPLPLKTWSRHKPGRKSSVKFGNINACGYLKMTVWSSSNNSVSPVLLVSFQLFILMKDRLQSQTVGEKTFIITRNWRRILGGGEG